MPGAGRFLLPVVLSAMSAFSQTTSSPPPQPLAPAAQIAMPSDPAELIALARKMNGIDQAGPAPWHLKATYTLLDDNGGVKETGTFEEFWVSDKKYKLSYSSPSFSQTDYSTEAGLFRSGNPDWPTDVLTYLRGVWSPYFPSDDVLKKQELKVLGKTFGKAQLKCITLKSKPPPESENSAYCFNASVPILRSFQTSYGAYQAI